MNLSFRKKFNFFFFKNHLYRSLKHYIKNNTIFHCFCIKKLIQLENETGINNLIRKILQLKS